VLVVVLANRGLANPGATEIDAEPTFLTWQGQTVKKIVSTNIVSPAYGNVALYCLFKPIPAMDSVTGWYPSSPTNCWVSIFTLTGVSTMTAPLAGMANSAAQTNLTFAVPNVTDGAFAAVCGLWSSTNNTGLDLSATSGTLTPQYDSVDGSAAVAIGTVSGLSAGAPSFACSVDPTNGLAQMGYVGAVFYPRSSAPLSAANSTITPSSRSLPANGSSTATITVQALDTNGIGMQASAGTVALQTTAGTLSSVTDNHDGSYTASLTTSSTSSGTAAISGTINGSAIGHPASVVFTAQSFSPGFLKLEVWTNTPGYAVADLEASPNYPASPSEIHYVPRFEIPTGKYIPGNVGGSPEGERLSGFIVPAQTANYIFYMSANVYGELWLSTNADPAGLQLIAQGNRDKVARNYDAVCSTPIPLTAGQRYYVQALQKADSGNPWGYPTESMAVTWTLDTDPPPQPGADPISGQFLGMFTATDTTPPAAVTDLVVDPNDIGSSWAWVRWTAPSNPGSSEPVASYDLRYSTQPITTNNWASATPVDSVFYFGMPAGTPQLLKVSSLNQGATYYFALRSENAAGDLSALSNVAIGTTRIVPPGGFNVIWDLEFTVPGADPTINGDWVSRFGSLPAGTTWADLVTNGILTTPAWNPILDTRPYDDFNTPWSVEVVCKCVDVVDPPDPGGWSGANFFNNMDTRSDGYYSQFCFGLGLNADGTQVLGINIDGNLVASYPGLSGDFHDIRVDVVDMSNQLYVVSIDSTNMGTNTYTRNTGGGQGNSGRFASILGWGYTAQWKSVKIGVPSTPPPPTLQIARVGANLVISWPATATGYTLQTTASLSPSSWSKAGDPVLQNSQYVFATPNTGATRFYRLSQ